MDKEWACFNMAEVPMLTPVETDFELTTLIQWTVHLRLRLCVSVSPANESGRAEQVKELNSKEKIAELHCAVPKSPVALNAPALGL